MRYNVSSIAQGQATVAPNKTATLNLRIDPRLKDALALAAERETRSMANMVEVLIRRHCDMVGIPIPEQRTLFGGEGE
jgi:hypothetical protein